MSKRRVHDYASMSDAELHALIHECNRRERLLTAPHAKGRRSWTRARGLAEAELARRAGLEAQ